MDELKQKLVEMMSWFHDFCVENGLTYYISCGTMLGAIRHGGFIPWDDDIDIAMPRECYEQLERIMKNNVFHDKYILETPNTNAGDFFYPFSKLYDTQTTLIENTKYKIKRGIYLDIFPIDGLGNSIEECKKEFRQINLLNKLLLLKVAGFRKGRDLYKNFGVALFRMIPINPKKILEKVCKKHAERSINDYEYCGVLAGNFNEIIHKKIYGKPTLYSFENIQIYGVEHPNEYLSSVYGDWKKLPPIDKQISQHDYIHLDLKRSYFSH